MADLRPEKPNRRLCQPIYYPINLVIINIKQG